jgi:WD40 repeat protein
MVKRPLVCLSVLGLVLGVNLLGPSSALVQTLREGSNPGVGQPGPPPVVKEVMAPQRGGEALCLAISPDGATLAAGCTDRSIYLLAPFSGEKRITLAGTQTGYVRGVAFVPGAKTISAVSDDNQVRLWDTTSGKLLKAFPALSDQEQTGLPRTRPNSLAVSPDGSLIGVGGGGTTNERHLIGRDDTTYFQIRVWDARTGELVWSHLGRRGFMCQLAFSPDGKTLASATSSEVKLWDAKAGDTMQILKLKSGTVWALAFSPDNRVLAGCGATQVEGKSRTWLTLWDLHSGAIIHSIDAGEAGGVAASGTLAFSPDGKSLANAGVGIATGRISIGGRDAGVGQKVINNIKLWDVATGRLVWTSAQGDFGHVASLVFSPDGLSVYCCDSSAVSRIDTRTGQARRDLMKVSDASAR